MIVDTSAIMAILLGEPEASVFTDVLFEHPDPRMSAGTWIELAAVTTRHLQPDLRARLQALRSYVGFRIEPVSIRQAEIGHAAYRTYGRGSGHRATLNLGDCFACELAREGGC